MQIIGEGLGFDDCNVQQLRHIMCVYVYGGWGAEREIDGCLFIYFWSAGWPLIRKNTDSNTVISLIKN